MRKRIGIILYHESDGSTRTLISRTGSRLPFEVGKLHSSTDLGGLSVTILAVHMLTKNKKQCNEKHFSAEISGLIRQSNL